MQVGAYILAGGKSERMGTDKAQLKIGDRYMIEYALDIAKEFNANPIIISNNTSHEKFGTRIPDLVENEGPAMGVYTALSHSTYDSNLILSCDMPLVTDLMMQRFDDLILSSEIVCFGEEFLYPFPGYYSKSILPKWKDLLEQGERKMQKLIKSFDYKAWAMADEALFLNVNTQEALKRAEEKLRK